MVAEPTLRPATADDAERLLDWRNDPATRTASFSEEAVALADHRAWLERTLDSPAVLLLVAEQGDRAIGQVRLDIGCSQAEAEVSITLASEARGRGLAPAVLRAAADIAARHRIGRLVARIKPRNAASLAAFSRAGYTEVRRDDEVVVLELGV